MNTGIVTFIALLSITAPYGRYSKGGAWGPLINAKVAWVCWESPAFLIPLVMLAHGPGGGLRSLASAPLSQRTLLMEAFLTHYFYRAFIYPLTTRNPKPAPLSVAALGGLFCIWNGFLQVVWHDLNRFLRVTLIWVLLVVSFFRILTY